MYLRTFRLLDDGYANQLIYPVYIIVHLKEKYRVKGQGNYKNTINSEIMEDERIL